MPLPPSPTPTRPGRCAARHAPPSLPSPLPPRPADAESAATPPFCPPPPPPCRAAPASSRCTPATRRWTPTWVRPAVLCCAVLVDPNLGEAGSRQRAVVGQARGSAGPGSRRCCAACCAAVVHPSLGGPGQRALPPARSFEGRSASQAAKLYEPEAAAVAPSAAALPDRRLHARVAHPHGQSKQNHPPA